MCRLCPSAIDGVACFPGSRWERFKEVAFRVFEHGITWERIAVLFYVAGKLAVKVTSLLQFSVYVKTVACWLLY